ncbi:response regulator transcription factor [Desulfuromonas carbonis]|uniref:response regulator transcription factor n=1 Tax=Desulfuromonas sp. DDH964 TaxID=1823759 RepID=UPI00078C2D19|nr:response regulator transcription factor [Desulfuromonas sp. DDH964]AMV70838.1 winged-helix transcriptional response regulator [Desulfuromonas sp. DDH964]
MYADQLTGPILVVEDDANTAALVVRYLEREGFPTRQVGDGAAALKLARDQPVGFVILDIMLPGADGWEVCRELRKVSSVPILILTAREEEIDRVLGLSLGADDYVVKPFSPRELVERVKAILRRTGTRPVQKEEVLARGGLVLDPGQHRVSLQGQPVELTAVEFRLLHALLAAAGRVLSREELLERIHQHGEAVIDRVIDVHIGKLRQKLGDDPAAPRFIETVRGFGYRLCEEVAGEKSDGQSGPQA